MGVCFVGLELWVGFGNRLFLCDAVNLENIQGSKNPPLVKPVINSVLLENIFSLLGTVSPARIVGVAYSSSLC